MSDEPPSKKRRSRWGPVLLVAGLFLLLSLGVVAAWLARRDGAVKPRHPPNASTDRTDPRRTYAGPYRNIDPDVRYVGDAGCVGCHEDIAKSYARHPMGRSLVPVAD